MSDKSSRAQTLQCSLCYLERQTQFRSDRSATDAAAGQQQLGDKRIEERLTQSKIMSGLWFGRPEAFSAKQQGKQRRIWC